MYLHKIKAKRRNLRKSLFSQSTDMGQDKNFESSVLLAELHCLSFMRGKIFSIYTKVVDFGGKQEQENARKTSGGRLKGRDQVVYSEKMVNAKEGSEQKVDGSERLG